MRKLALGLLAIFLITGIALASDVVVVVPAPTAKKDSILKNVEVGTEINMAKKSIKDVSDTMVTKELTTVGYKISDNLIPYAVLGNSNISFNQDAIGGTLADTEFRANALTYGLGARGKLLTLKNDINLGYDLRWSRFKARDDSDITVGGVTTSNKAEAIYNETSFLLAATKEFKLKDSDKWYIPKSLTPLVGYRFSYMELQRKDSFAAAKGTFDSNGHAAVLGVGVKMTDNLSITPTIDINKNIGGGVQATYKF